MIQFVNEHVKASKELILKALDSCFREDHIFLIKMLLSEFDFVQNKMQEISLKIEQLLEKYTTTIEKLKEIPGIEQRLAETIFIEATNNMKSFKTEKHFAAWSGVAPGNNESAGKKKRAGTRKGNAALKEALVQAALGASRKKGCYFHAKHNALRFRLGAFNKATVAIANKIARVVYFLIKDPFAKYKDLGTERVESKENLAKKAVKKLQTLGYEIQYSKLELKIN